MRTRYTTAGFAVGQVNTAYADSVDVESIRKSLRIAKNWRHTQGIGMETRPPIEFVDNTNRFINATLLVDGVTPHSTTTPDADTRNPLGFNVQTIETRRTDQSTQYAVQIVRSGTTAKLYRQSSGGPRLYIGAIAGVSSSGIPFDYVQAEDYLFITAQSVGVYSINLVTWALAQVSLYEETPGILQSAVSLIASVVVGNPILGEIFVGTGTALGMKGVLADLSDRLGSAYPRYILTEVDADSDTYWDICTQMVGLSSGCTVTLTPATPGATTRAGIYSEYADFRTNYSTNATVRIAGTNYFAGGYIAENFMTLRVTNGGVDKPTNDTFGKSVAGLRAAKTLSAATFKPQNVAFYQNRIVFGNIDNNTTVQKMRMAMSSTYDVYVVKPVVKLQDDASSPIDVEFLFGAEDSIQWIIGGDTLFMGTNGGVYALSNNGPLAPIAGSLPAFKPVGDYGSSWKNSFKPVLYNGNLLFSPNTGGIISYVFDFANARFNEKRPMEQLGSSVGTVIRVVLDRGTSSDPVNRMYALTSAGKLWCGKEIGPMQFAFTEIELCQGIDDAYDHGIWDICLLNNEFYMLVSSSNWLNRAAWEAALCKFGSVSSNAKCDLYVTISSASLTLPTNARYNDGDVVFIKRTSAGGNDVTYGYGVITSGAIVPNDPLPSANSPQTSITVSMPTVNQLRLARVIIGDERGTKFNQLIRVVRSDWSVRSGYQLFVNDEPIMPYDSNEYAVSATLYSRLPIALSGKYTRWHMGWSEDDSINISSMVGFSATIDSVTVEVDA